MSDSKKAPVPASAASAKRSKTIGVIAVVAGIASALVGLWGVVNSGNGMDAVDILLLVGGMLVSVLGFRVMRKAGAS
jgi:hypothetical protein